MTSKWYLRSLAPGLAIAAAAALSSEALARCDIPFLLTTTELPAGVEWQIECDGPWGRVSGDTPLLTSNEDSVQFYCASETITSAAGKWTCKVQTFTDLDTVAEAKFCLFGGVEGGIEPNPVSLTLQFEQADAVLTVNAPSSCDEAATVSFLGHASAGPAKAPRTIGRGRPSGLRGGPGGDRDTFAFEGVVGEVVKVTLEGDGTSGHTGDAARLRIQVQGGGVLDEKTGSLPLETEVTLPDTGTVEIVVEETSGGEPFRGHYLLRVAPDGGADDLLLDPQPDVEP